MANEITVAIKGDDQLSGVLGKATDKAKGFGGALKDVATTAGGFLVGGAIQKGLGEITGFMDGAVEAASSLGESFNAVNKIFGDTAERINTFGKTTADSMGLSQRAFNEMAVPLGAMLKNSGLSMDEVARQTINITARAGDMASVFNTEVSDALQAIQAGLRGEADPLERFGVGMSAAAVEAEALSMGLGKSNVDMEKVHAATLRAQVAQVKYTEAVNKHGRSSVQAASAEATLVSANAAVEKAMEGSNAELSDQEKMQARISLLFKQTADVQGDAAATADEFAGSQRRAKAKTEELQAQLGEKLIPVTQRLTAFKLKLTEALVSHALPAFDRFQAFIRGDVIPALQKAGDWVGEHVVPKLREFGDWIRSEGIPAIQELAGWFAEHMAPNLERVAEIVQDMVPRFREMGETLVTKFREVKPELQAFAEFMMDKVIPAVLFLVDKVSMLLVPAFKAIIESYVLTIHASGTVVEWFKTIGRTAADVGVTIKDAFVSALNWVIDLWNGLSFPGVKIPGTNIELVPSFSTPDIGKIGAPNASGGDKQFGGGGVRRFAAGGIVTRPTLAILGEGGQPETVTPMGRMGGAAVQVIVQAFDSRSAEEGVTRALEGAYRRGLLPRPS